MIFPPNLLHASPFSSQTVVTPSFGLLTSQFWRHSAPPLQLMSKSSAHFCENPIFVTSLFSLWSKALFSLTWMISLSVLLSLSCFSVFSTETKILLVKYFVQATPLLKICWQLFLLKKKANSPQGPTRPSAIWPFVSV